LQHYLNLRQEIRDAMEAETPEIFRARFRDERSRGV